jgi:hypothetical protein
MKRRQAERAAWMAAGAGLAGTAVGSIAAPATFPHAWLAALVTWLGWPLGCMGLLLIHALTGGGWGHAIRPQLVAGMFTLALLPPVLIPLILVLPSLYPWLLPEVAANLDNRFYLNLPSFAGRGIGYLIVWFGLRFLILRIMLHAGSEARLARIAPMGLILLAVTVTFSAVDTTMSLNPHFVSSVYGLINIAEMGLLALSVSVFAATVAQPLTSKTLRNLGRLLLALVILWAYLDFVQLLIIWQSDLPNEAPWYIIRLTGGWGLVGAAIAAGHFLLPFFVLLSPRIQQSRLGIACVTALLIFSAIAYGWWLVVPASGQGFGIVDVLAMLGITGSAAALALRMPPLPDLAETVQRHVS